jgi:hypothetical protein
MIAAVRQWPTCIWFLPFPRPIGCLDLGPRVTSQPRIIEVCFCFSRLAVLRIEIILFVQLLTAGHDH